MFNEELGKQVEERRSELNDVIEQLVLSEKKYKLLFANNPLPMMMVTLPEMGITDVNDAAIEQYEPEQKADMSLQFRHIIPGRANRVSCFWCARKPYPRAISRFWPHVR